jgi:hypothetical protein
MSVGAARLLLVGALGCGSAGGAPEDAVTRYLTDLGRDPVRRLELLTDGFHERHGLTVRDLEGWAWGGWGEVPSDPWLSRTAARSPRDTKSRLDRQRFAWLFVQRLQVFADLGPQLRFRHESTSRTAHGAVVEFAIELPPGSPFSARFDMSPEGCVRRWCIASIEFSGLDESNEFAAFLASPDIRSVRALRRARGPQRGARP